MSGIAEQLKTSGGREWLAMQFVLGELNDAQTAEFDMALQNDVSLCEAVADASRLVSGVMLACPAVLVAPRATVVRRVSLATRMGLFVAGAAVLVIIGVVVSSRLSGISSLALVADVETADALASFFPAELSPDDESSDSDEEMGSSDSIADLVAPEWLLTAVDLEQGHAIEADPDSVDVY